MLAAFQPLRRSEEGADAPVLGRPIAITITHAGSQITLWLLTGVSAISVAAAIALRGQARRMMVSA